MTSRERIIKAINHIETDELPVDFGATSATGINVSTIYRLYPLLGLRERRPVVSDAMQLLARLEDDVREALLTDVIPLPSPKTKVGTRANNNYKDFYLPDGTPALIDETIEYDIDEKGNYYLYPKGDKSFPPSMMMPSNGGFFDTIERCELDEDSITPREDFYEFGSVWDDDTAKHYETEADFLYKETDYAIACAFSQGGFGDLAKVPGPTVGYPKGIRTVESFLAAHILRPDYIHEVFQMQCETALKNLEILKQAVGDEIQVICMGGTDFGTQTGLYFPPEIYRNLYKPYIKALNDYVHKNTNWKTFWHSCGAISELLEDFIESGVDIVNPVQCSAKGMDPKYLKDTFGSRIVFWGGGIDTQQTLPFGTQDDVRKQVRERIEIFKKGGGFVFSSIHNIVPGTPPENIVAMLETIQKYR
ncbi:MAG: uroporphyrinogen decarboxylase family protein [Bacillota bacterium]